MNRTKSQIADVSGGFLPDFEVPEKLYKADYTIRGEKRLIEPEEDVLPAEFRRILQLDKHLDTHIESLNEVKRQLQDRVQDRPAMYRILQDDTSPTGIKGVEQLGTPHMIGLETQFTGGSSLVVDLPDELAFSDNRFHVDVTCHETTPVLFSIVNATDPQYVGKRFTVHAPGNTTARISCVCSGN